jgi:hypothetical protein
MRGGGGWSGDDADCAAHHSSSSAGELVRSEDARDLGRPVSISTTFGLRSYDAVSMLADRRRLYNAGTPCSLRVSSTYRSCCRHKEEIQFVVVVSLQKKKANMVSILLPAKQSHQREAWWSDGRVVAVERRHGGGEAAGGADGGLRAHERLHALQRGGRLLAHQVPAHQRLQLHQRLERAQRLLRLPHTIFHENILS